MKGLLLVEVEQWHCPLCFVFFFISLWPLTSSSGAALPPLPWGIGPGRRSRLESLLLPSSLELGTLITPAHSCAGIYIYMAWHLIVQRYSHFRRWFAHLFGNMLRMLSFVSKLRA